MYIHIFIEHISDPIYTSQLTHNVMSYIEYIQHMHYTHTHIPYIQCICIYNRYIIQCMEYNTYICTYICRYTHTINTIQDEHIYTLTNVHISRTYIHKNIYAIQYICMYIQNRHTYIHMYVHIHIYIYVYRTYTHITHTYICTCHTNNTYKLQYIICTCRKHTHT